MKLLRLVVIPGTLLIAGASLAAADPAQAGRVAHIASANQHAALNCEYGMCAEVANPGEVFGGEYVGHDEPSLIFYANRPGAGYHAGDCAWRP